MSELRKTSILCHRYPTSCYVRKWCKTRMSGLHANVRTLDDEPYSSTFFISSTFHMYAIPLLHDPSAWSSFSDAWYVQRDTKTSCQRIQMNVPYQNGNPWHLLMFVRNTAYNLCSSCNLGQRASRMRRNQNHPYHMETGHLWLLQYQCEHHAHAKRRVLVIRILWIAHSDLRDN